MDLMEPVMVAEVPGLEAYLRHRHPDLHQVALLVLLQRLVQARRVPAAVAVVKGEEAVGTVDKAPGTKVAGFHPVKHLFHRLQQ